MASIDKFNDHCWKDVVPESDLKLYAGWRRETFVGPRPALLAIDLYDLVYRGGPLPPAEINDRYPNTCGVFAHRAIAPTKKLIAAARRAGIPIFFCTQETRPNNRPAWRGFDPAQGRQCRSTAMRSTASLPSSPKTFSSPSSAPAFFRARRCYSHLSILGVQSLIVCGESTSGCVRASVVDGYSSGYHVSVVEECTYDRAELTHKVNLFDMHHKYADVMHVDEVLAHLDSLSLPRAAE